MPAAVIAFPTRTEAEYCILQLCRPGQGATPIGIFLIARNGEVRFRLRQDWSELGLDEDQEELVAALETDIELKIRELGGAAFLASLEDSLSNFLLLSQREPAAGNLDELFEQHVDATVRPYVTHLPLYSLQAAATRFGADSEVEQQGWQRVPDGLRLSEGMFVARVVGRSMEPLIPDGSFCIFRAPVVGSRQGKRLLIEQFGVTDSSARYTVKRYTSVKRPAGEEEGGWEHQSIRLEPLNREFPAFELSGEQFRVIGEFVQVLP